jgi:hypothetical protein
MVHETLSFSEFKAFFSEKINARISKIIFSQRALSGQLIKAHDQL